VGLGVRVATPIAVKRGEALTLRFGVFLHDAREGDVPDLQAVYQEYVRRSDSSRAVRR
jgi:hypothetical protein